MIRYAPHYDKWVELYESGETTYTIAKKYKCRTSDVSRGLKKMGVEIRYKPMLDETKRYERLVIKQQGCWDWKGRFSAQGYAVFSFRRKPIGAHRYSYTIHKGEPGNLEVCHNCDNKRCSNPDHLFLGTPSENQQDCRIKNRHKGAKLTTTDVVEIRKLLEKGVYGTKIAAMFGVNHASIYNIKNRKSWWYIK